MRKLKSKSGIEKVLIVGAGIGGLALALVLERLGIQPIVIEASGKLKEVGAGLGLWCNATRLLDRLGLGQQLRESGQLITTVQRWTSSGKMVAEVDIHGVTNQLGGTNLFIHRAHLQKILLAALSDVKIVLDSRFVDFIQFDREVVIRCANGREFRGDLLVGADGLRSGVRAQLWKDGPPRYSGETCWRAILHRPGFSSPHLLRQIYGNRMSVGICGLNGDQVHYRLNTTSPEGERDSASTLRTKLLKSFRGWPLGIPDLIEATPVDAFVRNEIYQREPLSKWGQGRVTLLGDAAHPSVPHADHGACLAIEDAVVLGRSLAKYCEVREALQAYERDRVERTGYIIRHSRLIDQVDRMAQPLVAGFREFFYRSSAPSFGHRFWLKQLAYDAGDPSSFRRLEEVGTLHAKPTPYGKSPSH